MCKKYSFSKIPLVIISKNICVKPMSFKKIGNSTSHEVISNGESYVWTTHNFMDFGPWNVQNL